MELLIGAHRKLCIHECFCFGTIQMCWRYDTQHNDIQRYNTQHNDIQRYNTQHNDIQRYNTQHNDIQRYKTQKNRFIGIPRIMD